jgi:hypothetical protein
MKDRIIASRKKTTGYWEFYYSGSHYPRFMLGSVDIAMDAVTKKMGINVVDDAPLKLQLHLKRQPNSIKVTRGLFVFDKPSSMYVDFTYYVKYKGVNKKVRFCYEGLEKVFGYNQIPNTFYLTVVL